MKIKLASLKALLSNAQFFNCYQESFDHVDVLRYSSNRVPVDSLEVVLYCATKASTSNDFTWYGQFFDGHVKLPELISLHPKWVFMVDDYSLVERYPETSIVYVSDVYQAVYTLYKHVLEKVSPCVCGITGSVGKTTTVGLLEEVFTGLGKKVLRIYSKRITPLSLFDSVINHLDCYHSIIVMEYSMYQDWHIKTLVDLLPPTFSGLLNIMNSHIGIGSITGPEDIFKAKSQLLIASKKSFIPKSLDHFLEREGLKAQIFNPDSLVCDTRIKPFVATKLWYVQALLSMMIVREYVSGCDEVKLISLINSYSPKEHRLMKIKKGEKSFFFDGDATNASRLYQLAENFYTDTVLILCDVDFGDEPLVPQQQLLSETFSLFNCVYISEKLNSRYAAFVREISRDKESVLYVEMENEIFNIRKMIAQGKTVFIHHGSYWRNQIGTESDIFQMFIPT